MKRIYRMWCALYADQSGQDIIEYALVAALIAVGAVATVATLGRTIANFFPTLVAKFYAAAV